MLIKCGNVRKQLVKKEKEEYGKEKNCYNWWWN